MIVDVPDEVLVQGDLRIDLARSSEGIVTVLLARPEARNAQTPATWSALAAVGDALERTDVRVVVLRGEGSAFSSGMDRRMFSPEGIPGQPSLASLAAMTDEALAGQIEIFQRAFTWQRRIPALTIAAVQGPAVGAGFQLALACDLLITTPEASFAMRETSYGLVPDLGGTQPLVHAVGLARAIELCATGRMISAQEGYALGFVTRVVDDLDAGVLEVSTPVLAAPLGAVSDLMSLLAHAEGAGRDAQRVAEREMQVRRLRALLGGA